MIGLREEFVVSSNPGIGVQASIALQAPAPLGAKNVSYVITHISARLINNNAPVSVLVHVQILDGATVIWQYPLAVEATPGTLDSISEDLSVITTPGGPATIRFDTGSASTTEALSVAGTLA